MATPSTYASTSTTTSWSSRGTPRTATADHGVARPAWERPRPGADRYGPDLSPAGPARPLRVPLPPPVPHVCGPGLGSSASADHPVPPQHPRGDVVVDVAVE